MCERYIIKDRWIVDTKLNKKIHSVDCYEEKSILDIMNGQDQRIEELEGQFAYECECNKQFVECQKENEELKQQLAEKDKEIEKLQHCNDRLSQGIYHSYGEHFILKVKQGKISFALEQLEKVKELINTYNKEHCFLSTEMDTCNKSVEIIDNQIKQLKEMK